MSGIFNREGVNDHSMLNRFSNVPVEASDAEQSFDLREALNFLWRQWKFIAAIVSVVLLIGAVQLMRQTPLYTASAMVLLEHRKENAAGTDGFLSEVSLDIAS